MNINASLNASTPRFSSSTQNATPQRSGSTLYVTTGSALSSIGLVTGSVAGVLFCIGGLALQLAALNKYLKYKKTNQSPET